MSAGSDEVGARMEGQLPPFEERSLQIELAAERLFQARMSCAAIAPVRMTLPAKDVSAAYAVQTINNRRLLEGGARRVGRKIGLTSPAVQAQLGVDQPDFGLLFDFMDVSAKRDAVSASEMISPRIEAEISFLLGEDITDAGWSDARLGRAIDAVASSVEIVDSAILDWDIDIVDTVADNASCGAFVVGRWAPYVSGLDLAGCAMRMSHDGEVVSTGSGAATLGNPLNALRWLADTLIEFGEPLRAGEIVLAGALGPMRPMKAGNYFIEIDGFDPLRVHVVS